MVCSWNILERTERQGSSTLLMKCSALIVLTSLTPTQTRGVWSPTRTFLSSYPLERISALNFVRVQPRPSPVASECILNVSYSLLTNTISPLASVLALRSSRKRPRKSCSSRSSCAFCLASSGTASPISMYSSSPRSIQFRMPLPSSCTSFSAKSLISDWVSRNLTLKGTGLSLSHSASSPAGALGKSLHASQTLHFGLNSYESRNLRHAVMLASFPVISLTLAMAICLPSSDRQ